MNITLIWAESANGYIGKDNKIPWSIPEDLENFKRITLGNTVVMGRKTWDSLPKSVKPLPQRTNVVLTSSEHTWLPEGVNLITNPYDSFSFGGRDHKLFIIGGKQIYDLYMPFATEIIKTVVMLYIDGDTEAPAIKDPERWDVKAHQQLTSSNGIQFSTTSLIRKPIF